MLARCLLPPIACVRTAQRLVQSRANAQAADRTDTQELAVPLDDGRLRVVMDSQGRGAQDSSYSPRAVQMKHPEQKKQCQALDA